MQLPDIPTPDDAIKSLLVAVFGSSATIVLVYALANAVMSWLGVAKTAIKAGKSVRNTGRSLLRLRPIRVVSTIAYTVTMLVLQALWLATAFVIGNGISWFFVGRPGMENGPNWQVFTSTLHADTVSNVYTGAGLLLLVIQYAAARRSTWRDRADRLVTWFNAPLFLIGGLCGVGAALAGLLAVMYMISHDSDPMIKDFGFKALIVALICMAYLVATYKVLDSPRRIAELWPQAALTGREKPLEEDWLMAPYDDSF
jgi:hypothetical protein